MPLFYQGFIGRTEADNLAFDQILKQKWLYDTRFGQLPGNIRKAIIQSWDRVLDMEFNNPYFTDPISKKSIQATFWSLRMEEVIKVEEFMAR